MLARNRDEAARAAVEIDTYPVVVKAQIHAGGRGKAGGVRVVGSAQAASEAAGDLIGKRLVTAQTGPEGKLVTSVLVEESLDIDRELYLGLAVDRKRACPVLLASRQGGMEIEEIAATTPGAVMSEWIDTSVGLTIFQTRIIAYGLGLDRPMARALQAIMASLYRLFIEKNCSHVEINPLVATRAGALVALDAKVTFDDNALFRHPQIAGLRDVSQEDPLEVEASKYGLNYIKLHGSVGCMVNGAGLAMATMDLIKVAGAEPANFLDVGGGASKEAIKEGLRILVADPEVKVVFVNIFGGILRCDVLARGITEAAAELGVRLPVVIRLEGTNVEEGAAILEQSGMAFTRVEDMTEGAKKLGEILQCGV